MYNSANIFDYYKTHYFICVYVHVFVLNDLRVSRIKNFKKATKNNEEKKLKRRNEYNKMCKKKYRRNPHNK